VGLFNGQTTKRDSIASEKGKGVVRFEVFTAVNMKEKNYEEEEREVGSSERHYGYRWKALVNSVMNLRVP
jgi:hypothetical protein